VVDDPDSGCGASMAAAGCSVCSRGRHGDDKGVAGWARCATRRCGAILVRRPWVAPVERTRAFAALLLASCDLWTPAVPMRVGAVYNALSARLRWCHGRLRCLGPAARCLLATLASGSYRTLAARGAVAAAAPHWRCVRSSTAGPHCLRLHRAVCVRFDGGRAVTVILCFRDRRSSRGDWEYQPRWMGLLAVATNWLLLLGRAALPPLCRHREA